jgi:hypothetical protein
LARLAGELHMGDRCARGRQHAPQRGDASHGLPGGEASS